MLNNVLWFGTKKVNKYAKYVSVWGHDESNNISITDFNVPINFFTENVLI